MSFVDKVRVDVQAGKGGDGKVSFRHEKFISKGGPDGGDGGRGGDVILKASRNQNTLAAFRYKKEIKADDGRPGGSSRKRGRSAANLFVAVPVGTVATNMQGKVVADLTEDGQEVLVAAAGRGGFGNAHFVSSRRQAPKFAEKGEPGEALELDLEIKMIADVGLVGLPNAGKSTLLSRLSNARPEIADYPFTTLTPNLGVVDIDEKQSVLIADIPGLIEGAAEGKGLGHDFLRHIERTSAILHLIDSYSEDVAGVYRSVRQELKAYSPELVERPEIVTLTKIEGLDSEIVNDLTNQLEREVPKGTPVLAISSLAGEGLPQLKYTLKEAINKARLKQQEIIVEEEIPVLTIDDTSAQWSVENDGDSFIVRGDKIERFGRQTDFSNEEGVQRLRDIMRRMGIIHELHRQGIDVGQKVVIGEDDSHSFDY